MRCREAHDPFTKLGQNLFALHFQPHHNTRGGEPITVRRLGQHPLPLPGASLNSSSTMDRYSHLRARAAEFVAEWVQWGEVLVVAPVREAAGEVALVACGDALVGVHRLAFRELVLELSAAELNRRAPVPVGRIVREALAARVTQEAVAAARLTYLEPVAGFPGFPRALAATFEELRLNAVPLSQLRECGESGADLALLLGTYRSEE